MAEEVNLILPLHFSKNVFLRTRVLEYCFSVNLNIIISHIFHGNSSTSSEDRKIFLFNINDFHKPFVFFVAKTPCSKKLMTSAYNSLHQYFVTFTLSRLINICVKNYPENSPALLGLSVLKALLF